MISMTLFGNRHKSISKLIIAAVLAFVLCGGSAFALCGCDSDPSEPTGFDECQRLLIPSSCVEKIHGMTTEETVIGNDTFNVVHSFDLEAENRDEAIALIEEYKDLVKKDLNAGCEKKGDLWILHDDKGDLAELSLIDNGDSFKLEMNMLDISQEYIDEYNAEMEMEDDF